MVLVLAYVFWHRRRPEISRDAYEESLIGFQKALKDSHLAGFVGSVVSRIGEAPWMNTNTEAYEDWYLLSGSEVMDRLNEVAVSGERKEPHDRAAHAATDGHGGLYQLRSGENSVIDAPWATWFSKPAGTAYERLYQEISEYFDPVNASLWRRQMVLAPSPEFCLRSHSKPSIPTSFAPIAVYHEILWRNVSR